MQEFDIKRIGQAFPIDRMMEAFSRFGLVVLKQYMSADTRDEIREILHRKLEDARGKGAVLKMREYQKADFLLGDVLSVRDLAKYDYVFFTPELVTLARALLGGEEIIYYGDSSTQFDEAARGFHKDNVDRSDAETDDWVGSYGLIRCAFYCEDHSKHSGGLKVRLSSQTVENCRSVFDKRKISHHAGRAVDVKSEYGDLVIWSLRLTHSGNYRKLRFAPALCVHPRIEMLMPQVVTLKEEMRRYFMSCTFARPGNHLTYYIQNMLSRDKDYRPYLERALNPASAREFLATRNVTFVRPCDYYARLDADA